MPPAAASTTRTTIRIGRPERLAGAFPRLPPSANPDITTASGAGGWRRSERPGGGGAATTWTGSAGPRASPLGPGGGLTAGGESEDCSAPSRSVAQFDLASTSGLAAGATFTGGAETGSESSASLGSSAITCAVTSPWTAVGAPSSADGCSVRQLQDVERDDGRRLGRIVEHRRVGNELRRLRPLRRLPLRCRSLGGIVFRRSGFRRNGRRRRGGGPLGARSRDDAGHLGPGSGRVCRWRERGQFCRLEKPELGETRGELLDAVGGQVRPVGRRRPVGHLGDRLPVELQRELVLEVVEAEVRAGLRVTHVDAGDAVRFGRGHGQVLAKAGAGFAHAGPSLQVPFGPEQHIVPAAWAGERPADIPPWPVRRKIKTRFSIAPASGWPGRWWPATPPPAATWFFCRTRRSWGPVGGGRCLMSAAAGVRFLPRRRRSRCWDRLASGCASQTLVVAVRAPFRAR